MQIRPSPDFRIYYMGKAFLPSHLKNKCKYYNEDARFENPGSIFGGGGG